MAKVSLFRDFNRTFWLANVMELFERAAYYGLNSVLAVYLTLEVAAGGIGASEQEVGFLQSILYALVYVLPILGGALADRYGYRRMLLVSFSLLTAGYFAAGYTSTYALVFLALLLMGTGAGLFKPIISGTIARTTDARTSALGFGIYYWMINLGAFLAPLVVSYLKGFSWRYVFAASAAYVGLMLIPTALLFRDPPPPGQQRLPGRHPQGRRRGAGRCPLHAHDRRLLRLLGAVLSELWLGAVVPAGFCGPPAGERRGHRHLPRHRPPLDLYL
jgi:MFS family permease